MSSDVPLSYILERRARRMHVQISYEASSERYLGVRYGILLYHRSVSDGHLPAKPGR